MKKQQQSRAQFLCLCFFVLVVFGSIEKGNGADDLATKCAQVIQKVIPCLNFATGKAPEPTKECCDAATNIKDTAPVCLCYIIQQTHKGSPESKSMGIQEDKLLQLPSVCKVKNANISDCPKLLGLSPNSPDAAIFTNASKATPATAVPETSTPPSPNGSYGSMLRPPMIAEVMAVALAIVVVAIPTTFVSIYT
ncbi:non-specific lipid transfer protein GPI-anchored 1-like [Gastrolobium bilobum]|uniref:non-specific lipid transfer protein GPI-anchored 1-like n=1 Tax=Gastrolobium bilobum TaxID=150636 RepID=UPI002AAF580A|nr:non-specific lipid transfer protein GPI-anchored 1-like [Gastrolobium bilobum]